MNLSKELIEKAKTAEKLFELAKAEGIELSAEQETKYFAELGKCGK